MRRRRFLQLVGAVVVAALSPSCALPPQDGTAWVARPFRVGHGRVGEPLTLYYPA